MSKELQIDLVLGSLYVNNNTIFLTHKNCIFFRNIFNHRKTILKEI